MMMMMMTGRYGDAFIAMREFYLADVLVWGRLVREGRRGVLPGQRHDSVDRRGNYTQLRSAMMVVAPAARDERLIAVEHTHD